MGCYCMKKEKPQLQPLERWSPVLEASTHHQPFSLKKLWSPVLEASTHQFQPFSLKCTPKASGYPPVAPLPAMALICGPGKQFFQSLIIEKGYYHFRTEMVFFIYFNLQT